MFLFLSQSVTSFSTFSLPGLWVCSLPDTQKTYKHLLSPLTRQNSGICHSVSDLLERTLQLKARRGSGGRGGGGTGYHVTLWDARDAGDVQSQCYPNWVTWEGRKKNRKTYIETQTQALLHLTTNCILCSISDSAAGVSTLVGWKQNSRNYKSNTHILEIFE